jgi:hypothetical protein
MAFSNSSSLHGRSLSAQARKDAGVAQLAEHPICNRKVAGSSPIASSAARNRGMFVRENRGQMAEWLMAADCKSAALTCYGGSNPSLPKYLRGAKASGRRTERFTKAHVAQSVEHVLGKDGVSSSILLVGSNRGSNSGVESQPSKLLVAGSNPVSRSSSRVEGFGEPGVGFPETETKKARAREALLATIGRGPRGFESRLPLQMEGQQSRRRDRSKPCREN